MAGLMIDVDILINFLHNYFPNLMYYLEENFLFDYFKNILFQWFISLFIQNFSFEVI
jgi:hemerythrin-like domain-containing protein